MRTNVGPELLELLRSMGEELVDVGRSDRATPTRGRQALTVVKSGPPPSGGTNRSQTQHLVDALRERSSNVPPAERVRRY